MNIHKAHLLFNDYLSASDDLGISGKCKDDVQRVRDGLDNSENWAYQMLDASTKIPVGLLTGNSWDLGNYDECVRLFSDDGHIQGKHCLATVTLPNQTQVPSLFWSYCVPKSCSARALNELYNSTITQKYGVQAQFSDSSCHTNDEVELSGVDIFSIAFFSFIALICLLSTLYDVWWKTKKRYELLTSFSIYTNGKRLLSVEQASSHLRPLHGIRFLTMVWFILGHRVFYMYSTPIMNSSMVTNRFEDISSQLVMGGNSGVDTFFLISGMLNAYHLLPILEKTKKFPAFKYYIHRYIRTTPALAAIIFIYASWYSAIGDGPLWKTLTADNENNCKANWWPTLLYISNYYNPVTQCAGQSWFLAVDMQLYWLSPLVIIPCWKWPKITKYYLGALLAISTIILFTVAYVDEIRMPFTLAKDLDEYRYVTREIYVPTHTRATPYIIGLMVGFLLDSYRKSKHTPIIPKMAVISGWILSTGLCLSAILGNYPFSLPEELHPYNRLESSFYIALFRIAWGVGISWVILACVFNYGGFVNTFLSWKGFIPLSRLTYCMFLCHLAVLQYSFGIERTTAYFQNFTEIHSFFGDLVVSIIAAAVMCLMFEAPVMVIEKYLLVPKEPKKADTYPSTEGVRNKAFEVVEK